MLRIELLEAGKRFNRDWIFRNLDATFVSGKSYLISGSNGSGKSTLLKTILGYAPLSLGRISYSFEGKILPQNKSYTHFGICAPYLELYDELTLTEAAEFHFGLKPILKDLLVKDFAAILELEKAKDKPLKYFSSGMKQRVRIGFAILSNNGAVLLDEPTSNLDKNAKDWYKFIIEKYRRQRLFIVSSNQQKEEYFFCEEEIRIEDYKI